MIINFKGPFTEYRIIVIAFTLKYDGEPSEPVLQRTDIAGPSAPSIINLTCHSQDALYLQWKRPTTFYNTIDFYVINYKETSYNNFQQIQLNTSASYSETAVCICTCCLKCIHLFLFLLGLFFFLTLITTFLFYFPFC